MTDSFIESTLENNQVSMTFSIDRFRRKITVFNKSTGRYLVIDSEDLYDILIEKLNMVDQIPELEKRIQQLEKENSDLNDEVIRLLNRIELITGEET